MIYFSQLCILIQIILACRHVILANNNNFKNDFVIVIDTNKFTEWLRTVRSSIQPDFYY